MKVVFFGTPEFAVPTLKRLLADPRFQVQAVVTQPDKRRGRGTQLIPSPVKAIALEHHLLVYQPRSVKKDEATLAELRSLKADVFVVVAYGQILSQEILDLPRYGCINNHGSLLPKYRGAAPIQWALYHGETETGITTMMMDAGMDTGSMLLKAPVKIDLLNTAQDLATRLADLGADLMIETLNQLEAQKLQPEIQDPALATYAPLIQKADYRLDWSRPAIALHNQVRGFFPNCLTQFRGQPLKIIATAPLGSAYWPLLPSELQAFAANWSDPALPTSAEFPGTVIGLAKNLGPIVQTGEGALLVREVQMAGKRPQSGWDFANGVRLVEGEFLEALTASAP